MQLKVNHFKFIAKSVAPEEAATVVTGAPPAPVVNLVAETQPVDPNPEVLPT